MIYLFHGSDTGKVRAKAFAWAKAARAKAPDAAYFRIEASELTEETLRNAISSQGLFFTKSLIVLDDPFSESAAGEIVLSLLSELADSDNPIAIVAPKLLATRAKTIVAKAEKVFIEDAAPKKDRGFNSALVNALGVKDRALLWKELTKAFREGDAPEAVHGLLHWKARDMMKKGSRAWTPEEARALSRSLIELLSDSRQGELPLREALERFALSL